MRSVRLLPAALGLVTALALTATACGPTETPADSKPSAGASSSVPADGGDAGADLTKDLADKLKKHGVDLDKWKDALRRSRDLACWAKMSRMRAVRSTTFTLTTSSRAMSWPG
ncbi:hypothetical protein STANM309S_05558 [Streptomyces tanashiensis]